MANRTGSKCTVIQAKGDLKGGARVFNLTEDESRHCEIRLSSYKTRMVQRTDTERPLKLLLGQVPFFSILPVTRESAVASVHNGGDVNLRGGHVGSVVERSKGWLGVANYD